ncbi:MAG TPA: cation-transporting P-type ATPase [Micromonosporaceae bacterium]|nr:cation-transporting P-type ATPase [Micromonosporaceae bacterium]
MQPTSTGASARLALGLTSTEARRRLEVDGRNETSGPRPLPLWRRVARQLADPLVALLLAAALVTALARDLPDTAVILLVIAVNTVIGVTQEIRADRAIAALRRLGAATCRVVRDGVDAVIPAAEAVRDDLVRLSAGDVVPADILVVEAHRLQLDESAVTGESVPVDREPGDELAAGTVVAAGRGDGTIVRTGAASALGRIVALTEGAHAGPTPLQRRLARLGRVLGTWVVALSAVVTAVGIVRGRPALEMAIVGVSLVVAAVPESLPAVVTLALALGARRMAAAHAVTRRLAAVETLGSVDTLISDKTGTLTQGRMAVRSATAADGTAYTCRGSGYDPAGEVRTEADGAGGPLAALATAVVLCNDADLVPPGSGDAGWTVAGEHIEGALLAFAARAGVDIRTARARHPRTAEIPFDQDSRMMTTEHRDADGGPLVVRKGAPEAILRTEVLDDEEALLARLRDVAAGYAADGLRVLAVASGPPGAVRALGVVGIGDPLRDSAAAALRTLAGAGVRTMIVTGDHPRTARRVAEDAGIWQDGDRALDCGTDGWDGAAHDVRIFARARPEQKLAIVNALKNRGAVVAVTGDGVNDAPALRRADIGVAMGGGTEVAHQAAQLVLADDELAAVGVAVAEGRRVYDNIRRFLRYALSGGVAELLTMLAGPIVGLAVPVLPAQILWINLLTHGLPGVAFGAEPASPGVMLRPPRPATQSVLGHGLGRAVLWTGALIGACTLAVGAIAARYGLPWQTLTFLTLGFCQLGVALAVRAPRRPGNGNPWLGAAVALSALLMLAGVTLPALRDLLRTDPVSLTQLACVLVVSLMPALAVAAGRRLHRRP